MAFDKSKSKAQVAAIKAKMGGKKSGPSVNERKRMQEEIREHSKTIPVTDIEKHPEKYRRSD